MDNLFSLSNKTILVTGASSGIGKRVSIHCAQYGAKLIISGRDKDSLEATMAQLEGEGHEMIVGDLREESFITDLCTRVPQLDGVVHSAGLMKLIPLKFINAAVINELFSINLNAPILLITGLVKQKKLKAFSSVIFMSSINGAHIGSKANSVYGATKGGIQAFTKSAALELSPKNIRVNCLAPGMIETEGVERIGEHVTEESMALDKKLYPLGRYGMPAEVAGACVYLLSDVSKWVTGITLTIDGGFTAQ